MPQLDHDTETTDLPPAAIAVIAWLVAGTAAVGFVGAAVRMAVWLVQP